MKAVITCAGLGNRLLPFTKELPKEMAPIFFKTKNGIQIIPLIQLIFENLYNVGIREFCFVTGKTKRAIENHFTPEYSTNNKGIMDEFYKKLTDSKIFWVTQSLPKGFGDAVKYAKSFVGSDHFILQAGDVAIIEQEISYLKRLNELSKDPNLDVVISVREVSDPARHGIVKISNQKDNFPQVTFAVEKPEKPPSNLGIMPIYLFNHKIFDALEITQQGKNNEIQLTDAIQKLIETGKNVKAIRVDNEKFWDVGTPEAYWEALNDSHLYSEQSK